MAGAKLNLPGLKFTIWVGWLTAVIFTQTSPLNFSKFRSWKSRQTVLVVILQICMSIFVVDFLINIFPDNVKRSQSTNPVTTALTQGFTTYHAAMLAISRLYLQSIAKPMSAFLEKLVSFNGGINDGIKKANGTRTGILVLLSFCFVTWESVSFTVVLASCRKESSWFIWMGNWTYTLLVSIPIVYPAFLVLFVEFALLNCTLDEVFRAFEDFWNHLSTLMPYCVGKNTTIDGIFIPCEFVQVKPVSTTGQKTEILYLLYKFREVKALFRTYDELMGQLILFIIVEATLGTISSFRELLRPDDGSQLSLGMMPLVNLIQYCLFLSVLNVGYRTGKMMEDRRSHLREVMARMPNMNEQLSSLIRMVIDWDWKMTAAGFFTVSRSLMGGIISTMLTYIVILFQLQDRRSS